MAHTADDMACWLCERLLRYDSAVFFDHILWSGVIEVKHEMSAKTKNQLFRRWATIVPVLIVTETTGNNLSGIYHRALVGSSLVPSRVSYRAGWPSAVNIGGGESTVRIPL